MPAKGLGEYQIEQERATGPFRERLKVIDDLLSDNQRKLERLLDLYVSGEFDKDLLVDRKGRLETTIRSLEKERGSLLAHLETMTLSAAQIQSLQDFATMVGQGLVLAEDDFEAKKRVIEMLDVQVTLVVENGEKVIYASCVLGAQILQVVSSSTRPNSKQERTGA
jgi:hypothetical protein